MGEQKQPQDATEATAERSEGAIEDLEVNENEAGNVKGGDGGPRDVSTGMASGKRQH
jgi:hypothetical protein